MKTPLIKSYCGDTFSAPPNTISAIQNAIYLGADIIHLDLQITKDGHPILYHDYYLNDLEKPGVNKHIEDFTIEEIKKFRIKFANNSLSNIESIPTLSDVMDLCKGKIEIELDLRTPSLFLLEKTLELVRNKKLTNIVQLTSPHLPLLSHARRLSRKIGISVFFHCFPSWMWPVTWQEHILQYLKLIDAQNAAMLSSMLDEKFVEKLHRSMFAVCAVSDFEFANRQAVLVEERTLLKSIAEDFRKICRIKCDQLTTRNIKLFIQARNTLTPG